MAQPPAALTRAGIAALLAVLCLVPGVADKGLVLGELSPQRPLDVLGVALILAQCLPLAVLGKWPLVAIAPAFAAFQLLGYAPTVASLGLLVALYRAGGHRVLAGITAAGYVLLAIGLHERVRLRQLRRRTGRVLGFQGVDGRTAGARTTGAPLRRPRRWPTNAPRSPASCTTW